jgi:hypothetical protein
MPATQTPRPDDTPAIAATASPHGLGLRDDRRTQMRPMSPDMRDLSPETYVLNLDTPVSI